LLTTAVQTPDLDLIKQVEQERAGGSPRTEMGNPAERYGGSLEDCSVQPPRGFCCRFAVFL